MTAPIGQASSHLKPPARLMSLRASVSMISNSKPTRAPSNAAPLSRANTMHSAAPPTRSASVHSTQSLKRFDSLFSTASSTDSIDFLAEELPIASPALDQAGPIPETDTNPEVFQARARSWSTATTVLEFEDDATERGRSYGTLETPTPSQHQECNTRPDRVDRTYSCESSRVCASECSTYVGSYYPLGVTFSSSSLQRTDSMVSTASTVLEQALDYDSDQISWEEIVISVPAK